MKLLHIKNEAISIFKEDYQNKGRKYIECPDTSLSEILVLLGLFMSSIKVEIPQL